MMSNDETHNNEATAETDREPTSAIPDVSLSMDARLEILAHHHRRGILRVLRDSPVHTASVDELTVALIDQEAERTGKRPVHDPIEAQLHHVHLPKLTEAGIIEYDARSRELRYWCDGRIDTLLEYLQFEEIS